MLMHYWLILVLIGLGTTYFFIVKSSLWWTIGAIIFCALIPPLTRDKNLLKILLPVTIILTIISVLVNLFF